jgi:hypothetical protein
MHTFASMMVARTHRRSAGVQDSLPVSWLGCVSAEIAPNTFDSLSRVPAALVAKVWLDVASFALNSVMDERLRACFVAVAIMRAWCYAMSSAKWLDSVRTVLFRRSVAADVSHQNKRMRGRHTVL